MSLLNPFRFLNPHHIQHWHHLLYINMVTRRPGRPWIPLEHLKHGMAGWQLRCNSADGPSWSDAHCVSWGRSQDTTWLSPQLPLGKGWGKHICILPQWQKKGRFVALFLKRKILPGFFGSSTLKQLDLLKMPTKNKTYPPEWFTMVKYANHNHLKQIQANMEDSNMLIGLNGWGFGWARCGGWCFAWWLEAFWRLLFWSFFWGDLYLNNETWKIRIWFGLKFCEGFFGGWWPTNWW